MSKRGRKNSNFTANDIVCRLYAQAVLSLSACYLVDRIALDAWLMCCVYFFYFTSCLIFRFVLSFSVDWRWYICRLIFVYIFGFNANSRERKHFSVGWCTSFAHCTAFQCVRVWDKSNDRRYNISWILLLLLFLFSLYPLHNVLSTFRSQCYRRQNVSCIFFNAFFSSSHLNKYKFNGSPWNPFWNSVEFETCQWKMLYIKLFIRMCVSFLLIYHLSQSAVKIDNPKQIIRTQPLHHI